MKKQQLLIILSFLLIMDTSSLAASSFDRGIGAQVGQLSSTGLSYYQRLDAKQAVQATIGLSLQSSYSNTTDLDYALGLEYQHTMFSATYEDWFSSSLYWFAGINHSGNASWNTDGSLSQSLIPSLGGGAGFGVESVFFGHFSIPISFGYGIFYTAGGTSTVEMIDLSFLAQIGARYLF